MPEPEAAAAAEEGCRSGDWGATKSTLALALAAKRTDHLDRGGAEHDLLVRGFIGFGAGGEIKFLAVDRRLADSAQIDTC